MNQPHIQPEEVPVLYARLGPRVKAVIRDFLVYAAGLFLVVLLGSFVAPGPVLRALMVVLFASLILYEPVLVAWAGGTLGHRSLNLRVVRAADGGRVSFLRALFRFVIKSLTGFFGFLAVELTRRHQGLHDLAAGTLVVPRTEPASMEGFALARTPDTAVLPSKRRRTLVAATYLLLLFILLVAVSSVVYSPNCLAAAQCTDSDRLLELLLGFAFVNGIAGIVVAGGRGHLPGARRRTGVLLSEHEHPTT